jgi:hypothetical protein
MDLETIELLIARGNAGDVEALTILITAQMRADGVDPEHLTLDQGWSYWCDNAGWAERARELADKEEQTK